MSSSDYANILEPDGWRLTPEGAAVRDSERAAVVADLHIGYEWARGVGGDMVPAHSLAEAIERLGRLLDREGDRVARLVVAGDLVETPRPCRRTAADVRGLEAWLAGRGVELVALRGNHDPPGRRAWGESIVVGGWTVAHGHRPAALGEGPAVFGHFHPAVRGEGVDAPCFLVGRRTIALPAFSGNAAGWNVLGPAPMGARGGPLAREPLRRVVALGGGLLDFGPLDVDGCGNDR